jgi:hypothetical protein
MWFGDLDDAAWPALKKTLVSVGHRAALVQYIHTRFS